MHSACHRHPSTAVTGGNSQISADSNRRQHLVLRDHEVGELDHVTWYFLFEFPPHPVRDLLAVSNEQNDLLMDLIEINREETVDPMMCGRCSQMSDDLKRVDGVMLCSRCREEDNIT